MEQYSWNRAKHTDASLLAIGYGLVLLLIRTAFGATLEALLKGQLRLFLQVEGLVLLGVVLTHPHNYI